MGYHRAGFDVVGVDINPQPRYPFDFIQADATEPIAWGSFNAIHASPPCQRYVRGLSACNGKRESYPDLMAVTRRLLECSSLPWVIENVPGAPMRTRCGALWDHVRTRLGSAHPSAASMV